MGFLLDQFREVNLRRGRLPAMRALDALPRAREGVFRLGVASGGGELVWSPLDGDPPHLLWAGTTGSGKTRGMVAMGLAALDWGWDVEVIDFKGGGDYFVLAARGAKVWITPEKSVESLKNAAKDIRDRNRAMWETPLVRVDDVSGRMVEDRAVNFADLHPAVKEENEWKPRLILIDETASLVTYKQTAKKGEQAVTGMEALRLATQLGRSAGVNIVLGMQRPDANLLEGGFIKSNIQGRIITGPADRDAEDMVHGSLAGALEEGVRLAPRPPGRGVASGFGPRPGAVLFQAYLLSKDAYLPDFAVAPAPQPSVPLAVGTRTGEEPGSSLPPDTPPGISSIYPTRASRRSVVPGFLALLCLRLGAIRLLFGPLRKGPFARDASLADACKRDAGRCRACGSPGPLAADHRRPLWAGGRDLPRNLWALCTRCHLGKTKAEARVRAAAKRLRKRPGFGWVRLPAYMWLGIACLVWGLLDGRWALFAGIALVLALWWEWRRKDRWAGIDGLLQNEARAERARYRGGMLGGASATYQAAHRTAARVRYGAMLVAGAYLLGVFIPFTFF